MLRLVGTMMAVLAVLLAAASAKAQARPRRHMGVQLRLEVGPSYLYAFQDVGEPESVTISGGALGAGLSLGEMVSDDLALNMDLRFARAGGAEHGVRSEAVFAAVHFGVGLTYWLMPANVYLAASLGAVRSSVEGEPVRIGVEIPNSDSSDVGLGLHLGAGKLWWVSTRWGLGLGCSLMLSTADNRIGGTDTNRNLVGLGLSLTTTYH
ncbi:MAG: hypothetical protein OEZ06_31815 [Myxococcales bacterium]|nr:hypothetical protein [Myxococcales bacterium]